MKVNKTETPTGLGKKKKNSAGKTINIKKKWKEQVLLVINIISVKEKRILP